MNPMHLILLILPYIWNLAYADGSENAVNSEQDAGGDSSESMFAMIKERRNELVDFIRNETLRKNVSAAFTRLDECSQLTNPYDNTTESILLTLANQITSTNNLAKTTDHAMQVVHFAELYSYAMMGEKACADQANATEADHAEDNNDDPKDILKFFEAPDESQVNAATYLSKDSSGPFFGMLAALEIEPMKAQMDLESMACFTMRQTEKGNKHRYVSEAVHKPKTSKKKDTKTPEVEEPFTFLSSGSKHDQAAHFQAQTLTSGYVQLILKDNPLEPYVITHTLDGHEKLVRTRGGEGRPGSFFRAMKLKDSDKWYITSLVHHDQPLGFAGGKVGAPVALMPTADSASQWYLNDCNEKPEQEDKGVMGSVKNMFKSWFG